MPVDVSKVIRQLQDHLQEGLLLVVGLASRWRKVSLEMGALAEHLKREIPCKLATAPDPAWSIAAAALDNGDNLEAAMAKVTLLPKTIEAIAAETALVILTEERKVFRRVLTGQRDLPLSAFLKHLFKAARKFHLITTNYDRLVEMAAEVTEIGVDSGFFRLSPWHAEPKEVSGFASRVIHGR